MEQVLKLVSSMLLVLLYSYCKADHRIEGIEVKTFSTDMGKSYYKVFHINNLVVYQNTYTYKETENNMSLDSLGNPVSNPKLLSIKQQYYYLIYHKDSLYGHKFDPYLKEDNRVKVNEALVVIRGTNGFDSFLTVKPDTVWKSKEELREVFNLKTDEPKGRLILNYSKKYNGIKESFNKQVDSVKGMKLFKYEVEFDPFDKWPASRNSTEMRRTVADNPKEILHYIKLVTK